MSTFKKILCGIIALTMPLFSICGYAFAEDEERYGIGMSPLNQKIILVPGQKYYGSFKINNPASHKLDFYYTVGVKPFYVDEEYSIYYENNGDCSQIVDWITTDVTNGVLSPNQNREIHFTIDVPYNAPAGGQYAAIIVSSDPQYSSDDDGGLNIQITQAMAHIIYAEIAGTTVRKGEVVSADVPGFLFSGNIAGNSTIKNTGNVHSTATYKLQVFPLFSNEEVYTNEEKPETMTILPDRSLYNSTYWNETPSMGIFNVVYTAEFEGVTTEVKKMVIVCPLWLLAVIIFGVILVIIWLASKNKSRKRK